MRRIIRDNIKYFIRFSLIGVSNTVIGLGLFHLLLYFTPQFPFNDAIYWFSSCLVAATWSYIWNKKFTFTDYEHDDKKFIRFIILQLLLAFISAIAIHIEIDYFHINPTISSLLIIPPMVICNFTVSKLWVFN